MSVRGYSRECHIYMHILCNLNIYIYIYIYIYIILYIHERVYSPFGFTTKWYAQPAFRASTISHFSSACKRSKAPCPERDPDAVWCPKIFLGVMRIK